MAVFWMHNEIEGYFRLNSTVCFGFAHHPFIFLCQTEAYFPTHGSSMRESQVYAVLKDNSRRCGIRWRVDFVKNANAVIDNTMHGISTEYSRPIY